MIGIAPEANGKVKIWGHGKQAVAANAQQDNIEVQVKQFIGYYQDLSAAERLRKAGMLSPQFWLNV